MNVPKFASFRPKTDTSSAPREDERSRTKRRDHDRERSDRSHRPSLKDNGDLRREASPPTQQHESNSTLFVVDRRGDMKNLLYGGLHRYDVPRFHRRGVGSVLGIEPHFKIEQTISDDKGIVLTNIYNRKHGRREKYAFAKMDKPKLLKIRPEKESQEVSVTSDFLPLSRPRKRKRKTADQNESTSSDSEDMAKQYRSIEGKARLDQPMDPALEYASGSESASSREDIDAVASRNKAVQLNREVEKSPHNIQAWLALISHQDVLLQSHTERRRVTNAEIQSTAEIKIHLYEKALENTKSLHDREVLLNGLMSEGSKIWEVKHQLEKWEQIALDNIESVSLWKSFLDFRQTTFTTFRFEEISALYMDRFRLLSAQITTEATSGASTLTQQLVYVLLRYTLFLRSSGFRELSIAIWQATLELNFRHPNRSSDWKSEFQDFWDSEVSRIGEEGSLGWKAYHQNANDAIPAPEQVDTPSDPIKKEAVFTSWAQAEQKAQLTSNTPAKTMDETIEDDPFRVILFADIKDCLFQFPQSVGNPQSWLVDGFLLFCRLPPITYDHSHWLSDAFVKDDIVATDLSWMKKTYKLIEATDSSEQSLSAVTKTNDVNFVHSSETALNSKWFQSLHYWKDLYGNGGPIAYNWVRNALKQLLDVHFTDTLAEAYLALEWRNEPSSIKKTAKALLKRHSNSLNLYNAYGLIEHARGNAEIATSVFTAAIDMSASLSTEDEGEHLPLWKSLIWCYLEDGNNNTALSYLLSIAGGKPVPGLELSPTALIRTKQHLTSKRDYFVTSNSIENASIYAELLALLAYLTSTSNTEPQSKDQGDIAAFLATIAQFTTALTSRNLTTSHHHELLLQSSSRLLYHHIRIGPFRPTLLRTTLQTYLTFFPSNTILLSLYTWNESRFRIENRVRTLLNATPTPSLAQHLFRIRYELQYGTIYSAKAAFEHALVPSTSLARSNAGIWKLYILFASIHFKAKAKDVWYAALKACPWEKELYITGFDLLGDKLPFAELKSTWRVMGEKGLRVHVDLEEVFEDIE